MALRAAAPTTPDDERASLVEFLEVPAECLADLGAFGHEVDRALRRLVHAGWIHGRTVEGVATFAPREVAEPAMAWLRVRLARDPRRLAAFERLDRAVTDRVLADYGHVRVEAGAGAEL